jgi:copper homeostasis protein
MLLEVIALDARDAQAAQEGGADRLELVRDMAADGLTPAVATARRVLAATDLPVRAMLRDDTGFAPWSLARLRAEAIALRDIGVTEFVLGWLTDAGAVDVAACQAVIDELDGCKFTFHRALDNSADPVTAWKDVVALGADTVLAAGSGTGVADGLPVLRKLAAMQEADGVIVMAGGGLSADQVPGLRADGVHSFHVGSAVRPGGWNYPVDAAAVARWVELVKG